ncbi:hypothetical protein BFG58_22725 [Enterobacter sp. ku-bf2]|nr:hypothetical protein BFG58_22725 [Enterobacter sp. ku-bf2]
MLRITRSAQGMMRKSLRKSMATGCQKFITLPGPGCCLTKMASRFLELLDLALKQFRLVANLKILRLGQKPRKQNLWVMPMDTGQNMGKNFLSIRMLSNMLMQPIIL